MGFSSKASGSFNVITLAKKILAEVDLVRSFPANASSSLGVYEESRVNAFLRLIGLPMFVNVKGKEQILNTVFSKYAETYNVANTNMRMVLGLEGIDDLSSELDKREGKYKEEEYKIYCGDPEKAIDIQKSLKDMISLKPDVIEMEKKSERTVYKKLFPLIPKYIEVNPLDRNIIRPFSDEIESRLYDNVQLKKPFLETVISLRFMLSQTNNKSQNVKNVKNILAAARKTVSQKEQDILVQMLNTAQCPSTLSYFIITQLLQSLDQLSIKYLELQQRQKNLSYWGGNFTVVLKQNGSSGPMATRISTLGTFDEGSVLGQNLAKLQNASYQEKTYLLLLNKTKNGGAGTYLASTFIDLLSNRVEAIDQEIAKQQKQYEKICGEADSLRAEIDFYTGEFNGLSALDVVAVIMGLFLISEDDLLALLDQETRDLVGSQPEFIGLQDKFFSTPPSVASAAQAVNNLQKQVALVYDYVNASIERYYDKNKRSTVTTKKTATTGEKPVETKVDYDFTEETEDQ